MKKRESRYVQVARLTYRLTQRVLRRYRYRNSPHRFTQPQVAACTLLVFYGNQSYRDGEEWLLASDQVCQALQLQNVPDYSTLCRMFHQLDHRRVFRLLTFLLEQLAPCEDYLALDSTSFSPSQASTYYRARSGWVMRDWFRGAYAVGTDSQLIVAMASDAGWTLNDVRFLEPLRARSRPYVHANTLYLADAGFDAKTVGEHDLIPPIRRGNRLKSPARQARADLIAQARLDGLFGPRWKVATVN